MHTKVRTGIIGVIAAVSLAAATIPATLQAATLGGPWPTGPTEPVCGPHPC